MDLSAYLAGLIEGMAIGAGLAIAGDHFVLRHLVRALDRLIHGGS